LLLALWALACYVFVLRLPFFHDDLPIMTWLKGHGWQEIWFSQENAYYRPLAFSVYKLGSYLPYGVRQVALHAVNLVAHWLSGVLVMALVRRWDREPQRPSRALLAGFLFISYPFLNEAVPWITALSHPLVALLALLAGYAAVEGEVSAGPRRRHALWALSLLAISLAPFAHESGAVVGGLVGGFVLLRFGLRSPRRWGLAVAGGLLNVAAIAGRSLIPGAYVAGSFAGVQDLFPNLIFFLQGLLYPLGPLFTWLVGNAGWQDFTLIGLSAALFIVALYLAALRGEDPRWVPASLWWWGMGALPAALSLRYAALFVSARIYSLAAPGVAILWAYLIVELGGALSQGRFQRKLLTGALAGLLLLQNFTFLRGQRFLYANLQRIYDQVLATVSREEVVGFVNLPASLTWEARTYPLVTDNVVFVPTGYSNLSEFVEVNAGWHPVEVATSSDTYVETDPFWLTQGPWLAGAEMRDFAASVDAVWMGRFDEVEGRFRLDEVGAVGAGEVAPAGAPLARFQGGPLLTDAAIEARGGGRYAVDLRWHAEGPVDATVFVHVVDGGGSLVAQADGAALGRTVPLQAWQAGDGVRDVRYFRLPPEDAGPYAVRVGLYNAAGRLPALAPDGARYPDDAVPIATIEGPPTK
jgi:hypothetical protein